MKNKNKIEREEEIYMHTGMGLLIQSKPFSIFLLARITDSSLNLTWVSDILSGIVLAETSN